MAGYGAEPFVALHVDRMVKTGCDKGEIDAETTREVDEQRCLMPLGNPGFVARRSLGGALLHVEVGRIDDAVGGGVSGQLRARHLPSGNLVERERQVDTVSPAAPQGQLPHIIVAVTQDKGARGLIVHG